MNKNFAIDLIAKVPPKVVKERVVYCDGGDEHLGHPRVYINLVTFVNGCVVDDGSHIFFFL